MDAIPPAAATVLPCRFDLSGQTFYPELKLILCSHSLPMPSVHKLSAASLPPSELQAIVRKHLPAWFKACAADAETIVMHEESFGASGGELFLLGCALKYAARSGKTVH